MPLADQLTAEITQRLAECEPDVELLLCELNGSTVRLYVDYPDGANLQVCERVTHALREVRERFSLEVSSPGPKRPLTKPAHFERFVGRRAKVRTLSDHAGQRNFTGEIVSADQQAATLAVDGTLVTISHNDVARAHLVPEPGVANSADRKNQTQKNAKKTE